MGTFKLKKRKSLEDFGVEEDASDVLTFSRWLHHLVMVLGGILVAGVFLIPVMLVSVPFMLAIHWLYPPADTYSRLVLLPAGYAVWRFLKWVD